MASKTVLTKSRASSSDRITTPVMYQYDTSRQGGPCPAELQQRSLAAFLEADLRVLGLISGHPNIVTLYRRTATTDRRLVLVLEYCGESFDDRVRRCGALAPHAAVSAAIKVAGALQTAHLAGLLYRQVAPQNVRLNQFGEPALAGLGLAGLASVTGPASGPAAYHAPPEVLEGDQASPLTDV